jgi:trimeric autotransporter adhesin
VGSGLLATTAGTAVAVPSRAGLRVSHRGFLLTLLVAVAVGVLAAVALPQHGSRVTRAGALPAPHRLLTELAAGTHRSWARAGLLSLPAAAQAPVSAALGRDQAAYQIHGLVARNPAQRLAARFGRSGVAVTAGSARFAIALEAFGRSNALRALTPGSPVASADRVTYARGPVREWWTNGPLGLEQGFDIARRPAGSGALTLSLAVSGKARLDHGTLLLPGGLRYAGLRATDARGGTVPAWLQVRNGHVLVRVNDRGARYPLRIDPLVQQAELNPSDGVGCSGGCDQFGYSVATSGSTVVVGAPYHAANSQPYSGAVYVFQMSAAGWASATQTAELTDSTLGGNRELGFSVAISSDGDTIAAGAPAGSEAPSQEHVNPCPTTPCTQGTVDVFTTTGNWTSTSTPSASLTASGTESPLGGELGWSVAISGTTIVAGAPYDASAYPYTGLAYVFNEPGGGWSGPHTQAAVLTASPLSTANSGEDLFGWSVGISGSTIVVGAPDYAGASTQAQGAAYVFTGPWSGTQNETAELLASDPTSNDQLGTSVAVSGNTVVAGAPNHTVGSDPGQGAAYVFVMPTAGPWVTANQTAELTASHGQSGDELGTSVAVSGTTIVAGARQVEVGSNSDVGAAYVYTQPAGGWTTTSASALS